MIRKTTAFLIPLYAGVVAIAGAQQAPKTQLTARELFYAAVESPKPATSVKPPTKAARKTVAKAESVRETRKTEDRAPAAPHRSTPATPGAGFVQLASERTTAPAPTAGPPLGLKCTILKLTEAR